MHIHFVGIGGIGMSALAQLCRSEGHTVSGSDASASEITKFLQNDGIFISIPQSENNIQDSVDLVVYTEAVNDQNPEKKRSSELGIPQKSYFEYLGEISKNKRLIAVAGTHGKTTTTGLIAAGMLEAHFDVTVVVGAQLPLFDDRNVHIGNNDWMLVEACEYRNNFRFLEPEIVVLTSFEWDHPDAFPDEQSYIDAFGSFLGKAKKIITFKGVLPASLSEPLQEKIVYAPKEDLTLQLIGQHNRENASLGLALAKNMQELDGDLFENGMMNFQGLKRRQEYLGVYHGALVYDDYGHHPTEIEVTLDAFREAFPGKKIGLVYEPHQFSRTRLFFDDFVKVLGTADAVGIFPIYEARDTQEDKDAVSSQKIQEFVPGSAFIQNKEDVDAFIANELQKEDILLFMGAGKISSFAKSLF